MMGYTHVAVGSAISMGLTICSKNISSELCILSVTAGALGGALVDIEVKDHKKNPKVTDASRTRIAVIGAIAIMFINDLIFKLDILSDILLRKKEVLIGLMSFIVLLIFGYKSEHRTFTHSLLFVLLATFGIYCFCPSMAIYFFANSLSHLILDMLNYKYYQHGIWLLYPLKIGRRIALGLCKSARVGNKLFYFIGMAFLIIFCFCYFITSEFISMIPVLIQLTYLIIVLHFVRIKSEKEQSHIMHIKGEL